MPEIHFAPLQGYTDRAYQKLHAELYGDIDAYYTPFIRMEKGAMRLQDRKRLEAIRQEGGRAIPQVIFRSVEEFEALTREIKELGFDRIDLNLGCPYPMQTRKGRGAAMIGDIDTMARVAESIAGDAGVCYSVKMRLGSTSPDEWRGLMPILNSMPLRHVTVHPRVARQMYEGELYPEAFKEIIGESKHPIIWNGDVRTPEDIDAILTADPEVCGVMIGRGLLGRPSLAQEWRTGTEWSREQRLKLLGSFHSQLLEQYESTLCGQTQILQKIKPFWDYAEWEIGHKAMKAIKKATTLEKYRAAIISFIY